MVAALAPLGAAPSHTMEVTRQQIVNNIYGRYQSDRFWQGYAGKWHLGVLEPNTSTTLRAMRMWKIPTDAEHQKFQASGPPVSIVQHNVYEQHVTFGNPTQRGIDGHWESSWERYFEASNFYEPFMVPDVGRPGWATRKTIAIDNNTYMGIPASLPTAAVSADEIPPPAAGTAPLASGTLAMELFLSDGPFRWSCGVVYDVVQRTLMSAALIGPEQQIELKDISDRIDFDDFPQLEVRDRLPDEPTEWISKIFKQGDSHGAPDHETGCKETSKGIYAGPGHKLFYYDSDAFESVQSGISEALKILSDEAKTPNNAFVLLPDSMYLLAPNSLVLRGCKVVEAGGREAAATNGFLVEFGGVKRSGGFQRVRVRYDVDGSFHSALVEKW